MAVKLDHGTPVSFFLRKETATPVELFGFIQGFLARTAESVGSFPIGQRSRVYLEYEEEEERFVVAFFDSPSEEEAPARSFRVYRDRIEKLVAPGVFEVSSTPGSDAWLISVELRGAGVTYYRETEAQKFRMRRV